ncbi:hypothetical protein [Parasitella parasitica]|uniref:Arrestin-like N-terminal domain-containing protein n=1 Tax=Parasitella parasitica TaxID=35722 RepID=A0A0B7NRM2_9FUNG|nr:hypothetical protein [Parasitella parasitica]
MHLSNYHIKNEVLKVVLDEPRIYVEESLGSVMVRGEVIVNFSRDTKIQGPIELLFEGIQRFHPWPLIMRGAPTGSPIETKLQVTELSLLPPNSKGIMPAGTQRFPFEFPIPASLPTSVYIKDRLEIFYQMSATLRRSSQSDVYSNDNLSNPKHWVDWARRNTTFKKKYTACSPLRIVRAMESIVSNGLPATTTATTASTTISTSTTTTNAATTETDAPLSSRNTEQTDESEEESATITPISQQDVQPWNRRGLDAYQGTYDEQHDQLASSFAGRSSGNLNHPIHSLNGVQGIRYKIGVDRTAIALGTSIGVELMIEPIYADAVIKSVLLKVSEARRYAMKVPAGHTWDRNTPATKRQNEAVTLVLKWADGYQYEDDEDESRVHKLSKSSTSSSKKKGERYIRQRVQNSQYLAYFDPPQPGCPEGKQFLNSTFDKKKKFTSGEQEHEASSSTADRDMINLKELNQPIKLGEYFGGRFVVPMPDCSHILHPSMDYESIKISHWMQLVVSIECNGKTFDLLLESPARILDCRLVADDDCQTVLPPPPSYQPGDGHLYHENNWSQSTFWEQREPITFVSNWGSCVPCPCEYKKLKALNALAKPPSRLQVRHGTTISGLSKNSGNNNNNQSVANSCPSSHLPEWGPPPCYSEE